MRFDPLRLYTRGLLTALALAAGTYTAVEVGLHVDELRGWASPLGATALGAATAALFSRRVDGGVRLAPAFWLAALIAMPAPAGLLVALAALLAGRGSGLLGPRITGLAGFGAAFTAAAVAPRLLSSPGSIVGPGALLALGLTYLLAQALAMAVGSALSGTLAGGASARSLGRRLLFEAVNVPLAWLLAERLAARAALQAAVLGALVLVAAAVLLGLDRAMTHLERSRRQLSSRVAELGTLHAIGREILSTLDPERVFAIIERECRKIFEVDHCTIALTDNDGRAFHTVYRRARGTRPDRQRTGLGRLLSARVAACKRGIRFDDLRAESAGSVPSQAPAGRTALRSAMAVPLIVEQQLRGVLSVACGRAAAYDDQQLELLTTIAHQAAVAIENARHYELATVDSLTGFHTRDHFFTRLEHEHRRARRYGGSFAVLMLDLDSFKEINDRSGHLAGDHFLRVITRTVRGELREADLPCRYGGDEFCVLLPETELEGARAIAERIREAVRKKAVGIEGKTMRTTVSIGLAAFPAHGGAQLQSLLRKADEALYRAKRQGRDRVVPYAA